ncbi:MAG: hypothetical protein WAN20_09375 [Pseudonocardiaceae bacterium]
MTTQIDATVPRVAPTVAALTAGATDREVVRPAAARSGSRFERVVIDGQRQFRVLQCQSQRGARPGGRDGDGSRVRFPRLVPRDEGGT